MMYLPLYVFLCVTYLSCSLANFFYSLSTNLVNFENQILDFIRTIKCGCRRISFELFDSTDKGSGIY